MIDAQTTQPYSTDCTEGEDVKLPCNHSTISGADYIHWYRQNPNQSPQHIIHGLQSNVTNSMASLTIASDRKSSTLVLPRVTLRDTAVYYCILRDPQWDRWGCTCTVSLWWQGWEWRGAESLRANLEPSRVRVREQEEKREKQEKEGARIWIKKRRKRGQGISASLVDVAERTIWRIRIIILT